MRIVLCETPDVALISPDTDLNGNNGSFILTQLVQLLLHATEDHRSRSNTDTQWLIVGTKNVLMLPLEEDTHTHTEILGEASTNNVTHLVPGLSVETIWH